MLLSLNIKELGAIETLEAALMTLLALVLPYSCRHVTLDADAGNVQVGCALLQKRPGDTTKPIR